MQIKLPNAIMSVEKIYSEALSQSDGKYLLSILPFSIEASFAGFYSHSLPRRLYSHSPQGSKTLYSHSPQLYSWIAEFRFQVEPLFLCQTHVMVMWRGHLPDCFRLIQWSSSVVQVPHLLTGHESITDQKLFGRANNKVSNRIYTASIF